jgi:hypothetical protein
MPDLTTNHPWRATAVQGSRFLNLRIYIRHLVRLFSDFGKYNRGYN